MLHLCQEQPDPIPSWIIETPAFSFGSFYLVALSGSRDDTVRMLVATLELQPQW